MAWATRFRGKIYELTFCSVAKSFRSESRASPGARAASGDYSFSNCAFYRKRCLRYSGDMAQTTSVRSSRLFQSRWRCDDDPVSNRDRSRSVAVAARRRETERQSAAAPDLRAHYWSDHFSALLETLASPGKGRLAARR